MAHDDFDSPFEQHVCEALRARRYEVHTQVGCSRVEPAIRRGIALLLTCQMAREEGGMVIQPPQ